MIEIITKICTITLSYSFDFENQGTFMKNSKYIIIIPKYICKIYAKMIQIRKNIYHNWNLPIINIFNVLETKFFWYTLTSKHSTGNNITTLSIYHMTQQTTQILYDICWWFSAFCRHGMETTSTILTHTFLCIIVCVFSCYISSRICAIIFYSFNDMSLCCRKFTLITHCSG